MRKIKILIVGRWGNILFQLNEILLKADKGQRIDLYCLSYKTYQALKGIKINHKNVRLKNFWYYKTLSFFLNYDRKIIEVDEYPSLINSNNIYYSYCQNKDLTSLRRYLSDQTIKFNLADIKEDIANLIANTDPQKITVALHIRRGDYLKFQDTFLILEDEYYSRAIEIVESNFENKELDYLVFCEDQKDSEILKNCKISYKVCSNSPFFDFVAMSKCDVLIMANSTFSYAASIFMEPQSLKIAPRYWYKISPSTPDFLLEKLGYTLL